MGRVVSRIIRGWDTCPPCGFAVGRGGLVVEGSWALGSTSDSGSGGIRVWVALVGRVAERIIMCVRTCATGRCCARVQLAVVRLAAGDGYRFLGYHEGLFRGSALGGFVLCVPASASPPPVIVWTVCLAYLYLELRNFVFVFCW